MFINFHRGCVNELIGTGCSGVLRNESEQSPEKSSSVWKDRQKALGEVIIVAPYKLWHEASGVSFLGHSFATLLFEEQTLFARQFSVQNTTTPPHTSTPYCTEP